MGCELPPRPSGNRATFPPKFDSERIALKLCASFHFTFINPCGHMHHIFEIVERRTDCRSDNRKERTALRSNICVLTTPAGESLVINDGHVEVLENGIIESVLGLRKLKGKEYKHDISRVVLGSMLAYIVLGIWVGHKQLLSHHHIIFITIIIFFQVLTSQHSLFAPTRSGQ